MKKEIIKSNLSDWGNFALNDRIRKGMEKDDIISFVKRNYPHVDLYETTDKKIILKKNGLDQLEIREDCLVAISRNNIPTLFYKGIKTEQNIKDFIDKYL